MVLLVHGAGIDGKRNWAWGYQPALEEVGIRTCTVDLFGYGMSDSQLSAERVVYAIRTIHDLVDGPVAVLGFSQGGLTARFALRFWPDIRAMVDDLVLLGAPISGTTALEQLCARTCAAALWQVRNGSAFLAATNSGALTFPGIDVTSVFTQLDAVVTPNDHGQASTLPGAVNVSVQDICPDDTADHVVLGTSDPVAYALALDALQQDGPADPARLAPSLCGEATLPGVTEAEATERLAEVRRLTLTAYSDARTRSEGSPSCAATSPPPASGTGPTAAR